jgi:hypothetical protein
LHFQIAQFNYFQFQNQNIFKNEQVFIYFFKKKDIKGPLSIKAKKRAFLCKNTYFYVKMELHIAIAMLDTGDELRHIVFFQRIKHILTFFFRP